MSCWALLALKPPHLGKTRLAGILSGTQRTQLVWAMLERVLDALGAAGEIDRVAVITPTPGIVPHGVIALADPGGGLNHALDAGRRQAMAQGADEVLILHADLPSLRADEVDTFIRHSRPAGLGFAPDRHGSGTNAIFLSPPGGFGFHFGAASFERHLHEARAQSREHTIVTLPGFAVDIDEPADLQHFSGPRAGLLEPFLPHWSMTRWTTRPQHFSPSHVAEHG